jgi:peptide chain release factor 3
VEAGSDQKLKRFQGALRGNLAHDHDGLPVYLAPSHWRLDRAVEEWPQVRFLSTREQLQPA